MELERHGLKVVLRKTDNFLPGDGDYLLAGRGGLTRKEIARHHKADAEAYDRYVAELETVVRLLKKWLLRAPPNVGRKVSAIPEAAEPRPRHGRPVARRNADRPRLRGAQRGRDPRPPFRGRPDQGAVRLRRRGRQFRLAAIAGHGLCPAPPFVRRGGRRARRVGPCDRRHGLDHPGDGARVPRGGRRHRARTLRSRKSSSRTAARRAWLPAARLGGRQLLSRASIRSCCSTGWSRKARSMRTSPRGCTAGSARARPSG